MRQSIRHVLTFLWIAFSAACFADENTRGYSGWQLRRCCEGRVGVSVPEEVMWHDYKNKLFVSLRPTFTPLIGDWQFAGEVRIQHLTHGEFALEQQWREKQYRDRGEPAALWLGARRETIATLQADGVTHYRLDRDCGADMITVWGRLEYDTDDERRTFDADDEAMRRMLSSVRCA